METKSEKISIVDVALDFETEFTIKEEEEPQLDDVGDFTVR